MAGKICGAFAGFAQVGTGIACLVIVSSNSVRQAGPGSCVFGAADIDGAGHLCDSLAWLALLTVFSSLLISVSQGALSLLCSGGVPPRGLEVLARGGFCGAWIGLSVFTTIATVQADDNDGDPYRQHWRHVGLGLSWAMAGITFALFSAAILGLCCASAPIGPGTCLLCCCICCPCCPGHAAASALVPRRADTCFLCAEILCLGWLVKKLFLEDQGTTDPHCHHTHPYDPHAAGPSSSYQPLPHAPPPTQPSPSAAYYPSPPGGYAPIPPPPAQGPYAPPLAHYPAIAPNYSPFTQGPPPPTAGWGVPVISPPHAYPVGSAAAVQQYHGIPAGAQKGSSSAMPSAPPMQPYNKGS